MKKILVPLTRMVPKSGLPVFLKWRTEAARPFTGRRVPRPGENRVTRRVAPPSAA